MPTILIVDDSRTDILLITGILEDFSTLEAKDGLEALKILEEHDEIDLILLDLLMPGMDGFELLAVLQERGTDIPVLILTNLDEIENEIKGLELGAVDFIRKPLNFLSLRKRVDVHLRLREAVRLTREHNKTLEETVKLRTTEVLRTNEIMVNALIRLLEVRNIETSDHARRTRTMMRVLCDHLASLQIPGYVMPERLMDDIVRTAPLHDIGKVGIPDSVLLKPGRLDPAEYDIMKKHVEFGVQALCYRKDESEGEVGIIETAKELIQSHHEWYDGSGYPLGLSGKDIPLSGRLMAVIDVYDALTSDRVYMKAIGHSEALNILAAEASRHFDPVIFQAFLDVEQEILAISRLYLAGHGASA